MLRLLLNGLENIWHRWLKLNKTRPRVTLSIKVAIIFTLFFLVAWQRLDPDFGWHLQSGNYFRKFGIPSHDIFTYTAHNFPWIDHEWGNDVIISYLYQIGGYLLVTLVFGALWTLALFTNAKKLPFPILWLAAIAMLPYAGVRPMVWTILGLALLIKWSGVKSTRQKALIPLGFIIWANLQGGFIVGFLYLAYLLVKERRLFWGWILLASGLASFINPYGPRLYVEIARTLTDKQIHYQIKEWAYFYIPTLSLVYVIFWAFGFWIYAKRYLSSWLSFTLLMLAAALSASRNLPLFVIASINDVSNYFAQVKKSAPKKPDLIRRSMIDFTVFSLVIFCLVMSVYTVATANDKTSAYPVKAVSYLSSQPCSGNLFNSYDYGGYLIWKLPKQLVYIDGRMPSWKDSDGVKYLDIYLSVFSNPSVQQSQFKQYNIRCVLVENDGQSYALITNLEAKGWKNTVQANNSILLIAPKTSN